MTAAVVNCDCGGHVHGFGDDVMICDNVVDRASNILVE